MSDTPLDPVRPTAAIERGQWVIDELGGWGTLASIVPPRFESYVRVFHAASGQDLRWAETSGPVRGATWVGGREVHGENEHAERWAAAALRWGTVFHPQAQWGSLTADYRQPKVGHDGWQYNDPPQGEMDLDELAAVATVLARHTSTPWDCLATLWEGYVSPGSAVMYARFVSSDEEDDDAEEVTDAENVRLSEQLNRRVARDRAMAQLLAQPVLDVPNRGSYLVELDIRSLVHPSWSVSSGWADEMGLGSLTPQSIWPEDRAWFLASEIDFDSTIVAGTPELIHDLLELASTGVIEALEIPADADLTITGDTINPMPPQPDYR